MLAEQLGVERFFIKGNDLSAVATEAARSEARVLRARQKRLAE